MSRCTASSDAIDMDVLRRNVLPHVESGTTSNRLKLVGVTGIEPADLRVPNAALYQAELHTD